MIRNVCTIVIHPPDNIISFVSDIKYEGAAEFSPFSSQNSKAHITLVGFEADDESLFHWRKYLLNFCDSKFSFKIKLGKVKSFPNSGVIYLALDDDSDEIV